MNRNEEDVIIQKIKNGDQHQVGKIYRTYRNEFIAWITSRYNCDKELAKDLYQTSIMILVENIHSGKLTGISSGLKTYLFAIGKNQFLKRLKEDARERKVGLEMTIGEEEDLDVEKREKQFEVLEICLEKLGDPCKSLLQLYYYHEMSMDEICNHLEYKNRDTVKTIKYKCLARLKKLFKTEWDSTIPKS